MAKNESAFFCVPPAFGNFLRWRFGSGKMGIALEARLRAVFPFGRGRFFIRELRASRVRSANIPFVRNFFAR
ncbi:MAG: hypothetical protein DBX55_10605 [Verrucomicrobia bacterium]|nr:MAG: hypothetical protein DBX55_10605 [Verrucomicrobiota bacterium]